MGEYGLVESFFTQALTLIMNLGYVGIALALMVEVIPSELILAYGGFMMSQGTLNFWGVVLVSTIGGLIAQLFLYWIGKYGGRPFLDKYGKFLFLSSHHLDVSERWFEKYGVGVIFFARFIPVVRHAISIPAGISKMGIGKFAFYTTLAILPWSIFFIFIGQKLGRNWQSIRTVAAPYVHILALVIVVGAVGVLLWKYLKRFKP